MALFGNLATIRAQLAASSALRIALDHAERCLTSGSPEHTALMALPEGAAGKNEIAGGVTALSSHAQTRPSAVGNWESHMKHIDVHVIVEGSEWMDLANVSELAFREHQMDKDAIKYHPFSGGSRLVARAGFVAVFFPVDAHRAGVAVDDVPAFVRKVVLKVPAA